MIRNPLSNFPGIFSRRWIARALLGFVEILIVSSTLVWLWTSEQGQHVWVWVAVGFPLFLAYVFIGGYVRHRLGLLETPTNARRSAENQSTR